AFDFRPTPDMIAESHRGKRPAPPAKEDELPAGLNPADAESGGERALVWKKDADNKVIPVRVIKGLSDGTRTVVTPAAGESLQEGDKLVTGIMLITEKSASGGADGNSPFGMKRPERRQRGTGGAEAKPGQNAQAGGRPGPPM
ncbi:MAG: hypothetical protein IJ985_05305, partial [Akkermansia sp.]|nr:hypothetical protein [Akkermansia sp.]